MHHKLYNRTVYKSVKLAHSRAPLTPKCPLPSLPNPERTVATSAPRQECSCGNRESISILKVSRDSDTAQFKKSDKGKKDSQTGMTKHDRHAGTSKDSTSGTSVCGAAFLCVPAIRINIVGHFVPQVVRMSLTHNGRVRAATRARHPSQSTPHRCRRFRILCVCYGVKYRDAWRGARVGDAVGGCRRGVRTCGWLAVAVGLGRSLCLTRHTAPLAAQRSKQNQALKKRERKKYTHRLQFFAFSHLQLPYN